MKRSLLLSAIVATLVVVPLEVQVRDVQLSPVTTAEARAGGDADEIMIRSLPGWVVAVQLRLASLVSRVPGLLS